MFPRNWKIIILSSLACTNIFANGIEIYMNYMHIYVYIVQFRSIQRTKRENLKAAKTTAIELEAEEKGNGIEEDCLYVPYCTRKLLWRHQMRGIWWNMVAVCSGWHFVVQDVSRIIILSSLVFSHSMGAHASTASESFCSRVIFCILIPGIIHQVCKVHFTINYSQACFSCMMLKLLAMDESEFLLTNQLRIGIIQDNTHLHVSLS